MPTIFCWDNLNKNIDKKIGGGSIHITPGIVFQENVTDTVHNKGETLQQKSKRLSIDLPHQNAVRENPVYINNKKILQGLLHIYNLYIITRYKIFLSSPLRKFPKVRNPTWIFGSR